MSLVATCFARPQAPGFIADTPEVTAEKVRFYNLYNEAARAAAAAPDIHIYSKQPNAVHHHQPAHVNTIHHHFNNPVHHQQHIIPAAPQPVFKWTGPVAAQVPAGLPGSGNVQNTAEVNAAIAEFNRAYSAAVASTRSVAPVHHHTAVHTAVHRPVSFHHNVVPVVKHAAVPVVQKWTGPLAAQVPAGLPGSSSVADTADVAQARNAFVQAYNNQLRAVLG